MTLVEARSLTPVPIVWQGQGVTMVHVWGDTVVIRPQVGGVGVMLIV